MSVITGWLFTTEQGIELDENTNYPDDIKDLIKEAKLPDNKLSLAKMSIHTEGFTGVKFHYMDTEIDIPTDKVLTFNPFMRGFSSGSSNIDSDVQCFYLLDGVEYPLKKNPTNQPGKTLLHLLKQNIR